MRVLILTGRFGMGHIAATQALQQEILREDPTTDVTVLDVIEACLPQLRHLIYGCFDFTVNYCSGVYNVLNRVAGRYPRAPMRRAMIQKVTQLLAEHQSDLLISTLPMCSQYISDYKQVTGDPIPLYTYITDLDAHNEWLAPGTNCYFVAAESTRQQLLRLGVPGNCVVVSGIPVRTAFQRRRHKTLRKQREVLIMGGGLGLIPHAKSLFDALQAEPEVHVTVITGKNETMRRELSEEYPDFTVLGFTDQVADHMRRADLLLTKAGGMTAFEAIHTGTPLCLLDPFLMQEEANAAYIEREGFGIVLRDKETATQQMLALLRNRDMLNDMRQRMAVTLRSLDQISALDKFWERRQAAC